MRRGSTARWWRLPGATTRRRAPPPLDARDEQTLGADLGDDCRADFETRVRCASTVMELVVRNAAIETEVLARRAFRRARRDGARGDCPAARRCRRAAGGRGGRGGTPRASGARWVVWLAVTGAWRLYRTGGTFLRGGILGRLLNNALDDAEKALDARVFGAAATAGPAAFAAPMRRRRDGELLAGKTSSRLPPARRFSAARACSTPMTPAAMTERKRTFVETRQRARFRVCAPQTSDKHETVRRAARREDGRRARLSGGGRARASRGGERALALSASAASCPRSASSACS